MNRNMFIFVMVFETFFALAAMGLLFSDVGALIYLISMAIFAAVLSPFYLCLKRAEDEEKKRKIRRNIALVMLLPIIAGLVAIVMVAAALMLLFA